jgi:hypothetical protein
LLDELRASTDEPDDKSSTTTILSNLLLLMVWEKEAAALTESIDSIPVVLCGKFDDALSAEVMAVSDLALIAIGCKTTG